MDADQKNKFMPSESKQLLDFIANKEPWCEYTLENGTKIRIRIMLTKVVEYLNKFHPNGAPVYDLPMTQVVDIEWPDNILQEMKARVSNNPST